MDTAGGLRGVVLCAGYGTRLGSLTRETPKPMLPVHGRPLLHYILSHFTRHGIRQVALNLHYLPEVITQYVGDGRGWGLGVVYSHEPELLGTAGALLPLRGFLSECDAFVVQYGDILTDENLGAMVDFHRQRRALVTVLLHQREQSNSIVHIDDTGRISGFWERPTEAVRAAVPSRWVNSAIYVCSPRLLDAIPTTPPCDLPRDVLPALVPSGQLYGFPLTGYRCAVDSVERLAEAEVAVAEGRCQTTAAIGGVC